VIRVTVILHSILRDLLPETSGGWTVLDMPDGASIQAVMQRLEIPLSAVCGINGTIERDMGKVLAEGDELRFFRRGAGG
jgi:hypothetical protein